MWRWVKADQVRAYGGFSCVAKKTPGKLRKVLMFCAQNYAFFSVRGYADQGLHGGGALARLHIPSDHWRVSAIDENNAFTRLVAPAWLHLWSACPPVPAGDVWSLLDHELRATLARTDLVAPCYMRLAMGASVSAFILMAINMRYIGMTLQASSALSPPGAGASLDVRRDAWLAQIRRSKSGVRRGVIVSFLSGASQGLTAFEADDGSPPASAAAVFPCCLLYTSPSPRDATLPRMPSSA